MSNVPTPDPAGPAPDPQERTTAIALLLNKLVLAAHARGYQEGREHIHEDDRITGAEVDRIEHRIIDQVTQLEADLTALRAERDELKSAYEETATFLSGANDELTEARARLAVTQADGVNRHLFTPSDSDEAICSVCGGWMIDPEHRGLAVPPQDQERGTYIDTYTPILWGLLTDEERYQEYLKARRELGRLAVPAWQDELRDRMEKFLRGGDDSDQQGIDLGERVRGWLSLLPPPAAEGETKHHIQVNAGDCECSCGAKWLDGRSTALPQFRCPRDIDRPLQNVNEMGTGNIK